MHAGKALKVLKLFVSTVLSISHATMKRKQMYVSSMKYESSTVVNRGGLSKLQNRYSFQKTGRPRECWRLSATGLVDSVHSNEVSVYEID